MTLFSGMNLLSIVEPLLLAATLLAFGRAKALRQFPIFATYLAFRLALFAILDLLVHSTRLGLLEKHHAYAAYYYVFWVGYLAASLIAFLLIQEIFRHIMQPLQGLGRLGLIAFRWVTLTSVLIAVALSTIPNAVHRNMLVAVTSGVMRCVGILELCLLAFIVLSMHTLRLSLQSRDFGIAFGLAVIAAADLFGSSFVFGHSTMATLTNYFCQIAGVLSIGIWTVYFVRAEPASKPVVVPVTSPLLRWNEVADALGHPPPHVVIGASSDFFLQDVERAVDRILEKNSFNQAS